MEETVKRNAHRLDICRMSDVLSLDQAAFNISISVALEFATEVVTH